MNKLTVTLCFFIIAVCSCKSNLKQKGNTNSYRYYYNEKSELIVKETYDSSGRISIRQTFNKDTVPYGAEIFYSRNGKINKWEWFLHNPEYPDCIVYYTPQGSFDTIVGIPFIVTGYDKAHLLCVKLVSPPTLNAVVSYQDSFQNKLLKDIYYPAVMTDSVAYICLPDHVPEQGHKYMLNFHIIDNTNHILSDFPFELENPLGDRRVTERVKDSLIEVNR